MTARKRLTTAEERALFESAVGGRQSKSAMKKAVAPEKKVARRTVSAEPAAAGLDGATAQRLKRGKLEPESRLDLHGLTEAQAYRALVTFLRGAHARGLRLLLVVTGKGRPVPEDRPFDLELLARSRGVLRTLVPRWLCEPELARFIAKTEEAHRRHGGGGALYVYLRKKRS